MTKHAGAKLTYNAIFQEYSPPGRSIILGEPPRNVQSFDKGISCHVFAIASPITWAKANEVNTRYSDIGSVKAMQRAAYDRKPTAQERSIERPQNMAEILAIRQLQETVLPVDDMYMCGGYREAQVVPEHMWIEDHTNDITYDTFIDRNGIAVVEGVGADAQAFKPGCEGHAFRGGDIQRVKVDGYTWGQLLAIAAGAEKVGFPDGIKNNPVVLAAKMAIKEVETELAKIPDPGLTEEEIDVVKKVYNEQRAKKTQSEIDNVVKDDFLTEEEKLLHTSALEKLKTEGEEQRRVAQEIVGRGPQFFLNLIEKANERIEATVEGVTDVNVKAYVKKLLEKQRDNILAGDSPVAVLDAFNKSMSNGNIIVLAQGIKDGLTAIENSTFGVDGDQTRDLLVKQVKTLIASYVKNDGKLTELSLNLTAEKNQLAGAGQYAAVLAVAERLQNMENLLSEEIKTYTKDLVDSIKALPIEQRVNFPNSKEPATLNAIKTLLSSEEDVVDVEKAVTEKLDKINKYLDKKEPKVQVEAQI